MVAEKRSLKQKMLVVCPVLELRRMTATGLAQVYKDILVRVKSTIPIHRHSVASYLLVPVSEAPWREMPF
jgi:hypothetical protein